MLLTGLLSVLSPVVLLTILGGVVLGIIFGSIPGLSATMAVALCLPISFGMPTVQGVALLLGLYIGGISGGLISAILIKIPGTPSSVATVFDGAPMSERGQAGKALGTGILFSFLGTVFSVILLMFLSPPIAKFALKFSPYEYFAVTVFSLTLIASLSEGSMLKGLLSGCVGIAIAMVGAAPLDSFQRFSYGQFNLSLGFQLLSVLIGFYAIPEILVAARDAATIEEKPIDFQMKGFGLSMKEFVGQLPNALRSALIGLGIGLLPGIGGGTSNLIAYASAKKASKTPEKFGTGIIDGVVASETSNNASIGGALIPLLTLGIPGDTVTAMLLGGLMMQGVIPGPMLFKNNGPLVYSIFGALFVASVMMLLVEYGGIRMFVRLLKIPKNILLSVVLCLCVVGAIASNNRLFDAYAMIGFGLLGYWLTKMRFPLPPLILGFILSPTLETNLRRGMQLSGGDFIPFLTRPISMVFLGIAMISFFGSIIHDVRKSAQTKKAKA